MKPAIATSFRNYSQLLVSQFALTLLTCGTAAPQKRIQVAQPPAPSRQ